MRCQRGNPAGTHNRLQSAHNGSTRACRFEKVLFQFFDRGNARTYAPHAAPPPQRREGRRGQASSHTLPAISPSPSLLLLSSDNICTPKFIKSMTLFLSARLDNYIYLICPRALSLPLFLVQKGDDKRRIPSAGAAQPLSPPLKKKGEQERDRGYTPPLLLVASSCCIGWCCRLWTP